MAKLPQIPSSDAPIVDDDGVCLVAWYLFFTSFWATPLPIEEVGILPSPMTFTASYPGSLLIVGGAVSQVELTRSTMSIVTGATGGFIPVGLGDEVEITYAGAPDVYFIPR